MLTRIEPDEAEISRFEVRCALPHLRERLAAGTIAAYRVDGTDAILLASRATTRDSGRTAAWIEGLCGSAETRRPSLARDVLATVERLAVADGCEEIRVEAGTRLKLKQRLLGRFGFVLAMPTTGPVMLKALNNGS